MQPGHFAAHGRSGGCVTRAAVGMRSSGAAPNRTSDLRARNCDLHCSFAAVPTTTTPPPQTTKQLEGKPELRSSTDLLGALHEPSARVAGFLLLLATADGRELSSDSKAAPALAPVPGGPRPLPFVGNLPVFLTVRSPCCAALIRIPAVRSFGGWVQEREGQLAGAQTHSVYV